MSIESIVFDKITFQLKILNQLLLPSQVIYEKISNVEDAWKSIKEMKVRGAPAIAIVAILSIAVELSKPEIISSFSNDSEKLLAFLEKNSNYLVSARPTAVNISREFRHLLTFVRSQINNNENSLAIIDSIKKWCYDLFQEDRKINEKIAQNGFDHIIKQLTNLDKKVNILTHCNTGSLATSGYGTALGVIRKFHQNGRLNRAFCTETRPYNQGSRLTAWELLSENIPSTLICDSMVASLMESHNIDAIVVGADHVLSNGDTANKIGTYQIAILARYFSIPFYVASPVSTIDLSTEGRKNINIEIRPDKEMKFFGNFQIAPSEMHCWNPAFDVTPVDLITGGIITEYGVLKPGLNFSAELEFMLSQK